MIGTLTFEKSPLPPSSNNQYVSIMRHGKMLRVPSKEYAEYKRVMKNYWLSQVKAVIFAREALEGFPLYVHIDFKFENSRMFTKKGHFKRLDVSNRLKAIHDSLAEALLIDDSQFVRISAEKIAVARPEDESATISIEIYDFASES